MPITQSVGRGGANRKKDVRYVQLLLNGDLEAKKLPTLKPDGIVGPKTIKAIEDFQRPNQRVDGRVDPNGSSIRRLESRISGLAALLKAYAVLAIVLAYDPTTEQTVVSGLRGLLKAVFPARTANG